MSLSSRAARRVWWRRLLLSVLSLFLTAACATTSMSVNDLMKDPGRYRGRSVSVTGVVTYSASYRWPRPLSHRGWRRCVVGREQIGSAQQGYGRDCRWENLRLL